jgi:HSP20 family protein
MIDIHIINQPLSLAPDNDPDPTEKAVKKILNLRHSNHPHTWHPPTDLYETEEHYIVRVEVAGMNKEEFCVNLEEDRLDISGSRPDLQLNRAYHQMEIPYGNFRSTIKLPSAVDGSQVTAEYHDGFLIVTLPKAFPTIIEIKEE